MVTILLLLNALINWQQSTNIDTIANILKRALE
jgi:hypothetical protein